MTEAGMLRRWRPRAASPTDPVHADLLARQLRLHPLLATLLVQRGITDPAAAARFLKPKLTHLHDPALLPGLPRAAQRILDALRQRQPIVIYGDYDVDGVTAAAILWRLLRALGADVSTYVPHRIEEGYGLNTDAIAELCLTKPLIVSVDCGITAVEPAKVARDAGVDLVITDHHEFSQDQLPGAYALVHPRLGDGAYPFPDLCGAGVAYKLAWQVARTHFNSDRLPDDFRGLMLDLLSYAALGTVADVVPLVGENRVLAVFGLGQIKRTRFVGLNALIEASDLADEKIDAYHAGFVLGPRLNACGRMGHAADAVKLLTTDDATEALRIARFLTQENLRRRAAERAIFTEARQMVLERHYDADDCRAIVVGKEGWHPGVVGIVASRLVEEFARPVVMLHIDPATRQAQGSARSVAGLSLHEALGHCAAHFTSWGGHAMAAGLRMSSDRLDAFRQDLVVYVNQKLSPGDLVRVLEIDATCALADVSVELWRLIDQLAPFGRANPAPLLRVTGVKIDGPPRRIGAAGKHLRLILRHGPHYAQAVGFGLGDLADRLHPGHSLDAVFEPKLATWQGQLRAEMHLKDLRLTPR